MGALTAIKPSTVQTWLSPADVANRVPGITVANLQELRKNGRGPRYYKPTPKTVVYSAADIDAWVAGSVVMTRAATS